ncbi:hypothetical protein LOD99_16087 [Oopsacas minuta]|uniref:Deoxynucleoside kinase domain-containing protein n=1 Tax=Oopsacas minuta TaxID=111878 RepID=A0AAV7K812_9METZ|nr:hypothetical protein LOD99_16087 [Oopsacas minuta]
MKQLEQNKYRVVVEGNIACGKSTLLRHLSKVPFTEVHYEPIDRWRNIEGENLLARYYSNATRYAYLFQQNVLQTMMEIHHLPQTEPLFVMERSAFSSRYCFVKTLYENRSIEDLEFNCFDRWFKWLMRERPPSVDLIIYLRTSPETCLQRLYSRSREEDKALLLPFIKSLDVCYEQWLGTPDNHIWHNNTPVLLLDGNLDVGSDAALHNKMVSQIIQKLENITPPEKVMKAQIEVSN